MIKNIVDNNRENSSFREKHGLELLYVDVVGLFLEMHFISKLYIFVLAETLVNTEEESILWRCS